MKIVYRILFSIEFRHDFYNEQIEADDILITPDERTLQLFKGVGIVWKTFPMRFVCLIEVDEGRPFKEIREGSVFRLLLSLKNPHLPEISALKAFDIQSKIYRFSNTSGNNSGGVLYLSKPIAAFDNGINYESGSLVSSGPDTYEAIKRSGPSGEIHETGDEGFWRRLLPSRFPVYDEVSHSGVRKGMIVTDSSCTSSFEAKKDLYPGQDISLVNTDYWRSAAGLQYVTMSDLADADSVEGAGSLGVAEIEVGSAVPTDFRLLDGSGIVRETTYTIRFKNRISNWRYNLLRSGLTTLLDVDGVYSFTKLGNSFVSDTPIPLLARPGYNFRLVNGTSSVDRIRCASGISRVNFSESSFESDIFLNN